MDDILGDMDFESVDSDKGEEVVTFKHDGKEVSLSPEEAKKLIPMGYDYTKKTQKIAPYRKLIELLENDPEALNLLDKHFKEKLGGAEKKEVEYSKKEYDPKDQKMFLNSLKASHDDYDLIMEKVKEIVSKEPLKIQILADQDVDVFMEYFSRAKKSMGKTKVPNELVQSGRMNVPGLEEVDSSMVPKKVWEMNRKDFDSMISKIKGY